MTRAPEGSPCRVSRASIGAEGHATRSSSRRAVSRTATGTGEPGRRRARRPARRPPPAASGPARRCCVAVLGDPQELGGREEHALGGAPAGLGGDRRDPAVRQAHHGLVQQRELAVVQGGAQPGRPAPPCVRRRAASAGRTARRGPCRPPWRGTSRGRRCAAARRRRGRARRRRRRWRRRPGRRCRRCGTAGRA